MKPAIACLALFAPLFWPNFGRSAEPRKPNVLLIVIDDLNDWVGFLQGHPQVKTPHMDRLAKRGIVFANAHCAAPLCCPSRSAIFSGLQPFRTGIYTNGPNIRKLRPDLVLLPQYFAFHGYRTYGTGKLLHHRSPELYDEHFGTEQRWSPFSDRRDVEYAPEDLDRKRIDPRHTVRLRDREVVLPLNGMPSDRNPDGPAGESFDWGPFDVEDDQMGDGKITAWAVEKLQDEPDRPFFLAVGFYRPHIPLWAPRSYFDLYPEQSIFLPETIETDLDDLSRAARRWALEPVTAGAHATVVQHKQWKAAVAAYLSCISFVDAQVGRLLEALDESPHADNTIVVLLSDHGWHLGEKEHWGKWTGWERATRVPLVIVPPRPAGSTFRTDCICSQPVGLIDLYPTLIELCGLPARNDFDGESLVASLKDPNRKTEPELSTFGYKNYSIRGTRWRLIRYQDGSEELYDHTADPHEWHNLVGDARYDEIRRRLANRLPQSAAASLER